MPVPHLEPEQRRAALEKAAAARRERADLKRAIASGELTLEEILDRAPTSDAVAKMKVMDLLEALPHVGKVRARAHMERVGIASNRRIKGLGPNQRRDLLARLDP